MGNDDSEDSEEEDIESSINEKDISISSVIDGEAIEVTEDEEKDEHINTDTENDTSIESENDDEYMHS